MVGVEFEFEHVFAGIAVEDYDRAIAWYERLFGRSADVIVRENNEAMWQVSDSGWVYVVRDAGRSGNALLTMLVDDLDKKVDELQTRGFTGLDIETEPGRYRKVTIEDPEGNTVAIGQALKHA
jgi:predicted enzyme related to lactoylglutathione lyase